MAAVQGVSEQADTAFAKLTVDSDRAALKKLKFGYSDKVKVYVNNRLVYSGDNTFRSRDYRYLGTIGLFDAVYIPLEPGNNEILFAVSEQFGGWGVMAAF